MRKRVGAAVAALVVGTMLSGCWTQVGFDAGRTNWNPGEQALRSDNVHLLAMAWQTGVGASNAPISVGGVVYVSTRDGEVAAFDAGTGALRWRRDFYDGSVAAAPTFSSPAWHAGELLVPATFQGKGGLLHLDPADGSTLGGDLAGEPTTVVAIAGDEPAVLAGTTWPGGFGIAHISWKFEPTVISSPLERPGSDFAIVGERVMWSLGNRAQGFSAACPPYTDRPAPGCAPDWSTDLGGLPSTPTAVGSDAVAFTDDTGTLTVLDAATGEVRWIAETGITGAGPPTVAGDTILVTTAGGRLLAYAAEGCGAPECYTLWAGREQATASATPVATAELVFVPAPEGELAAYSLDGCGEPSCAPLIKKWAGNITHNVIVDDGHVFGVNREGTVTALSPADE